MSVVSERHQMTIEHTSKGRAWAREQCSGMVVGAFQPPRVIWLMRLPGAVHRKSGKVAELIQCGEGPVELETLGLTWPEVKEWAKRTAVPRNVERQVFARICEVEQFFGLGGEARIDELVNLAQSVPPRVPGACTNNDPTALAAVAQACSSGDGCCI